MKIVIVGNGMVGFKCCEKLRSKLPNPNTQITVFGEEPRPAYDRVHLTDYFTHHAPEELELAPSSWYADHHIELKTADPIVKIDRENKRVYSSKGFEEEYDALILATGSSPLVPNMPGTNLPGVFVYRTIEDLEAIKAYAPKARNAAVLGGGLLGLEAAKALVDLGIGETHIVEYASRLMPKQIDHAGHEVLQRQLENMGLKVHTNRNTFNIYGHSKIEGMQFSDGARLEIDMLIISAGIRPRDQLAKDAGLETGSRGGITVNDLLQTSDPSIYAIGECAIHRGMVYGLVAPGYEMAEVAAATIAGEPNHFPGYDLSTKLKLIGIDVASFGDPFPPSTEYRAIVFEDRLKGIYKKINISNDGQFLIGGILVGDAKEYNMLLQTTKNKLKLPANPEDILLGNRGNGPQHGLEQLPPDAVICSCENVSKGDIVAAVSNGHENFNAVKKCTKAGSCCGGCSPMVKDIITHTMQQQGKYTRKMICEHFEYSRQELYDLIKIKELKSFEDVLDQVGKGDGCEVCKPTVASIMASLWNEMILEKGNDTAQDSNDRFLANIQKGGTYSVVPRIPGGEITPKKLMVIARVADKYGLYTKITGGQRIDMFGAHLNDLPNIWEELIAAGFESGHAYGKALRTVKSCVGSTWCRFGLHDSVSFAIRVEERYRGLRAPHKIKSAVSGCTRECAEAQSKDFGIIATDKGWNLYVCGNGGAKPQHAQLLAADLDSETCIRFIDRFLMFYIKTADPLTRTATWLNKLDGGISYLRNVVVNDSLGIAGELEAAMQQLVDQYKCEWKEVVNTPALRKRFSHFVNAPTEKDPTVQFSGLRDQKRAAEWTAAKP
ncbi:nitrite reductase (NAD(P)H) [Chitinophaga caeni]|uniref:Nitrite reductase (NAD(P)H) n=1 Tax=Chitinophaga caeni TaxID=2029983 RepID=A0A291QT86_9BACT|nr:nitrite reductase large subunit NirB [Chitinophaga caeni]ATL47188.1 nitrite reductase (NAD(P)H) [Chitinophaga caeni]